ncbi:MAG: hypothetical protein O7G85_09775 [Planctomycetota bacterium]|nr:hypothetical protein [Planctomycetota bacterium]
MNVTLQWATYRDASDQCSLSRIWGGIHPGADDLPGRQMGLIIGPDAYKHAGKYFSGRISCPADTNGDRVINVEDLLLVLAGWGPCPDPCDGDMNDVEVIDVEDLLNVLAVWGMCP